MEKKDKLRLQAATRHMMKHGDPEDLRFLNFFRVARGFKDLSHYRNYEKKDEAIKLAKVAQLAVEKARSDGSKVSINPKPLILQHIPQDSELFQDFDDLILNSESLLDKNQSRLPSRDNPTS